MGIEKARHKGVIDLVAVMTPGVRYSGREIRALLGTAGSTTWMLLRRAVLDGRVCQAELANCSGFWIPEVQVPAGGEVVRACADTGAMGTVTDQ